MSGPGNIVTSGDYYGYNEAATEIITDAYRIIGVIDETENPSPGQFRTGMVALNSMIKELEATGIHVWTEEEAILFLQQGQSVYYLGNNSTDHCADAFDYVLSQISANAPQGANSVTLTIVLDITVGDNIGVVLDNGFAFWTTVASISGNTVTFPIGITLPYSASYQNFVFDYTTPIVRPLRIPAARRIQYNGLIETPLTKMMSRQEYMDLPNKYNPGVVTQAFYNPSRDQGQLFAWNTPVDATNGLRFTWYRPIQDFINTDDAPDVPEEWLNCLNWNLALELCPRYSVPAERWDRIGVMAKNKLELVAGWDREYTSVYFALAYDTTARY
jgi:hypothetical protein